MSKNIFLIIFIAVLITIGSTFCFSREDGADRVGFTDLIATTSETHLILFGTINNSFTDEMLSGLKGGVPLHFSFFIELFQKEKQTPERTMANLEFRHTMTYDTLKDSYKVELGEINNKVILFKNIDDAQKTMNEVNGVKIVELEKLVPDRTYQLRIRADLFEKTLPLSLHRILPFLSWWDRETAWHSLEFNY
jgi:hypothetical protein